MAKDFTTPKEDALEAENASLRDMLAQVGIDASQLLENAGIDATEHEAAALTGIAGVDDDIAGSSRACIVWNWRGILLGMLTISIVASIYICFLAR